MMAQPTPDIQRSWLNIARRLQSVATNRGYAVLTLRVLVGPGGSPVPWAEPQVTRLEPASSPEIAERLRELAKDGTLWEVLMQMT
jgi:hypothetical protein